MKRTVLTLLNNVVNDYPDKPYVAEKTDQGWVHSSYKEVKDFSEYLAAGLLYHGFRGKNISILSEGRINWIVSEYAIIKQGGISVPLSTKLLPEEIPFRVNHSESSAIFVSKNNIDKVLQIFSKLKHPDFRIIYYDTNREDVKQKFADHNIDWNIHLLFYADLMDEGKKRFESQEPTLREIEDYISEDDVVTLSYTSGTTGNPKGIMLTQLNYYGNSKESADFFQLDKFLRLLVILPIDHSFAHTVGLYTSLVAYFCIYFVDSRGGAVAATRNIPQNMKEVNPHFLITVPALTGNFMQKIKGEINKKGAFVRWLFYKGMDAGIEYNGNGYNAVSSSVKRKNKLLYKLADKIVFSKVRKIFGNSMQYCIGGGALLDISQQRFFYTLGIPVYQGYGLTEASPIISTNHPNIHKLGTSGKVLPTLDYKIIKSDGNEAQTGEDGELIISGTNVMKGYYKNPDATAESIQEGWLYTGDLGFIDQDGFLAVVGRKKALLISEDGEKYSPEEIEEAIINSSDMIQQVMIHNDHNKYTSALVTLNENAVQQYVDKNNIDDATVLLEAIKQSFYSFKQEKDYANKFQKKWIPATFRILDEHFTEENHMINSTMKMVRYKIREAHEDKINYMYTNEGGKINNPENIRTIQEKFL